MANIPASQQPKAANKAKRYLDGGPNPFLVESVFEEKSDSDNEDEHANSKEPFLTDSQLSRASFGRTSLLIAFSRYLRKRRRRYLTSYGTPVLLTHPAGRYLLFR